jgi:Protein of unknown function (DUF2946)
MDEIVKAALLKWPGVPHCYGWLALDARGDWYLRDAQAQAAGLFPRLKGSRIEHAGLRGFIERNYDCDSGGRWFFQNGPQRVYVELEAAPRVYRIEDRGWGVADTAGHAASVRGAWVDEQGRVFLEGDLGFGLVHTLDTGIAADALDAGQWPVNELPFSQMPARFGYVLCPQDDHGPA